MPFLHDLGAGLTLKGTELFGHNSSTSLPLESPAACCGYDLHPALQHSCSLEPAEGKHVLTNLDMMLMCWLSESICILERESVPGSGILQTGNNQGSLQTSLPRRPRLTESTR